DGPRIVVAVAVAVAVAAILIAVMVIPVVVAVVVTSLVSAVVPRPIIMFARLRDGGKSGQSRGGERERDKLFHRNTPRPDAAGRVGHERPDSQSLLRPGSCHCNEYRSVDLTIQHIIEADIDRGSGLGDPAHRYEVDACFGDRTDRLEVDAA